MIPSDSAAKCQLLYAPSLTVCWRLVPVPAGQGHPDHEDGNILGLEPLKKKVFVSCRIRVEGESATGGDVNHIFCRPSSRLKVVDRVLLIADVPWHCTINVERCYRRCAPRAPRCITVAAILRAAQEHVTHACGAGAAWVGTTGKTTSDPALVEILGTPPANALWRHWWR